MNWVGGGGRGAQISQVNTRSWLPWDFSDAHTDPAHHVHVLLGNVCTWSDIVLLEHFTTAVHAGSRLDICPPVHLPHAQVSSFLFLFLHSFPRP